MKKITVALDEKTATWARVQAAERNMSLSRYVGEMLRDKMRQSRAYEQAMRKAIATKPLNVKGRWKPYPKREELYDRPVLRRR